jgi:hypothetical protein
MAICPECHTMDKNFFAPKCHACNTPVGFINQCIVSLMYNVVFFGTLYLMWLLVKYLFWNL